MDISTHTYYCNMIHVEKLEMTEGNETNSKEDNSKKKSCAYGFMPQKTTLITCFARHELS